MDEMDYIYLGDRLTRPELRRMPCRAVRRSDGKCIRGRNGNMLVEFDGVGKCVILGRLLRKIKKPKIKGKSFGYLDLLRIFAAWKKVNT